MCESYEGRKEEKESSWLKEEKLKNFKKREEIKGIATDYKRLNSLIRRKIKEAKSEWMKQKCETLEDLHRGHSS